MEESAYCRHSDADRSEACSQHKRISGQLDSITNQHRRLSSRELMLTQSCVSRAAFAVPGNRTSSPIWQSHNLKPHRVKTVKLSRDALEN